MHESVDIINGNTGTETWLMIMLLTTVKNGLEEKEEDKKIIKDPPPPKTNIKQVFVT